MEGAGFSRLTLAEGGQFDLKVVENELKIVIGAEQAAARIQKLQMRLFDPMLWIQARHGKRFKLDDLLRANNLAMRGSSNSALWRSASTASSLVFPTNAEAASRSRFTT